jgi:general secretion pathway protein N
VIDWLEANPVGKVLASVSAALMAVLVLLALAWSLPPHAADEDGDESGRALSVQVPELAPTEPIEEFAIITERPVFNESREPEIFDEAGEDGELAENDAASAGEDVEPPEVALSGVVITPTQRIVTLRPKDAAESLIALEGNPLEGDFGSWQVSEIEPRSVVLSSRSGEEVRIDLQIHDAVIEEPPEPPPNAAQESGDEESDRPLSRAEEIRQRIAERREELRRAAEENAENERQQPSTPNYQDAIKKMIQGKQTRTDDENE